MALSTVQTNKNFLADAKEITDMLKSIRGIDLTEVEQPGGIDFSKDILSQISSLKIILVRMGWTKEAESFDEVYNRFVSPADNADNPSISRLDTKNNHKEEILFILKAYLMGLNAADTAYVPRLLQVSSSKMSPGMTLSEKILLHHSASSLASITPGDVVTVHIDWILASELSWHGMSSLYDHLLETRPGGDKRAGTKIFRNNRFWLAGDHLVTTQNRSTPPYSTFAFSAEKAYRDFHMTEYQGMNYTIMHTEFVRNRALPGQLILGSDSHTCSAGAVGSLALGLGTSDVVMPLITGQTWIKVPECIRIDFTGEPRVGIGGKDVILHVLGELGRNTVAKERIVEFGGPGAKHLSTDARFAICNMCAEFGAVSGLFIPDEQTKLYLENRKRRRDREGSIYFKPDDHAAYAQVFEIDLSTVMSTIARYPNPDDVVPVRELSGIELDGCFIGACTTAEEDLILAALVLEAGLNSGYTWIRHGKRKVVPGSIPIRARLDRLGLTEIYHQAGFEVGEPSCSYCVGLSEDKAASGEVWLSSQNRNFRNRMGPGAIGHITSALVVAASSFNMVVTDPNDLVQMISRDRLEVTGLSTHVPINASKPMYVEPSVADSEDRLVGAATLTLTSSAMMLAPIDRYSPGPSVIRRARIQILPSFVDTDALAPNESLAVCHTPAEFAQYCLKYTHSLFRQKAKDGASIIVTGEAFGCGSSREVAVTALLGCGIQAIIATSFSFIFARNAANLGLLCIVLNRDSGFYDTLAEDQDTMVEVDVNKSTICVYRNGQSKVFAFKLSSMERQLVEHGGMVNLWKLHGTNMWNNMVSGFASPRVASTVSRPLSLVEKTMNAGNKELSW